MPIGNANIHIQINVSELINKLVTFLFCEFNRATSWKEGKKYYFRTFISNCQIEILVSFSRSTNVNVYMSFLIVILKDICVMHVILTLSIPEKWKLDITTYIMQKILNFFIWVEVRILCKKVKYVWGSHFPEAITTNMQLGTTPLCLNTRLRVNKKFQNSH